MKYLYVEKYRIRVVELGQIFDRIVTAVLRFLFRRFIV